MTKQEQRLELEFLIQNSEYAGQLKVKKKKKQPEANFVEINIYNRWTTEHVKY